MYVSAWPSEFAVPEAPQTAARQRAEAAVSLVARLVGNGTGVGDVAERGSARVRVLRRSSPALEAVLINTGGGIAGGDRFAYAVEAEAGAELAVTTVAAEKVYRSDGAEAVISTACIVGNGARLQWLPQESILFDGARLDRSLTADVGNDAELLVLEAAVFGRGASGEDVRHGLFRDRWRVRREGRLVYGDTLRLDGAIARQLDQPGVAGGARAMATALYVAPDAEERLNPVRAILGDLPGRSGASAWNGCLVVRFLAPEIESLRRAATGFLTRFRGSPLPRVWQS